MFKFLKEKLKESIKRISGKIEEEGVSEEKPEEKIIEEAQKKEVKEEIPPETKEEKPLEEKKGFFSRLKDKFLKKEEFPAEEAEEVLVKDEVKEYQVKHKIVEEKKELEKKEEIIQEKLEQKEIPTVQELEERRGEKEKIEKLEKWVEEPSKEAEKELDELEKKEQETKADKKKEPIIKSPKEKETIQPEKKGFFERIKETITTTKINKKQFEEIFWDLEVALLENNVAVEVIEKIKQDLESEIVEKPIRRSKVEEIITETLKHSLEDILNVESFNLLEKVKTKKPFIICFVGINGSGKTTTIAKMAHMLKQKGLSVLLVAGDTWRQAAIEQIETWAKRLNVPIVKHTYGSDPAAVAFDGIQMAKARNMDVVLIDTAGRMHSNVNLVQEMQKIVKVAKPDLKIFIGESITGNDCVEQGKKFDEAIGLDGIILSKADVDEKGGAAISISYVTGKPIIYIGTGQELGDLETFNSEKIIQSLGLEV